jgi:predicted O-methyltransferase YrrM
MSDSRLLNDLAMKYGSDKASNGNTYMGLYNEYFQRQGLTREGVSSVLEIGTNKGASLRVWADFFPKAQVYGLDITRQYELPGMLDHDRIHTAIADQADREAIKQIMLCDFGITAPRHDIAAPREDRQFDIIIDDGSHEQADQQISLGYLFFWLKPGGLYVVEDVITGENWWSADQYNKQRIMTTRAMAQTFEQTSKLESSVMKSFEIEHIMKTYDYCEYRESPAMVFGAHHPQLVFIGKK